MKLHKRIIALSLTFAMCFSLFASSALAVTPGEIIAGGALVVDLFDMVHNIYKEFYNADGIAKPGASAGWTNGGTFGGGAGRKDYTDYVTGLETTLGSSTLGNNCVYLGNWSDYPSGYIGASNTSNVSFSSGSNFKYSFRVVAKSFVAITCVSTFVAPVSGIYTITPYSSYSFSAGSTLGNCSLLYMFAYDTSSPISFSSPYSVSLLSGTSYSILAKVSIGSAPVADYIFSGAVRVEFPVGGLDTAVGNIPISQDTRTGSLSGNFGYTGPDGTMITAENIKIVNETTNTLFNPVTNTTTNFKDWTYDYSSRTYNVTLDSGTKQTITYGDENVTIKEGDTIYNIYYVTPDGGTPPPKPPGTCVHDYVPAVTKAPTCLLPGVKTLTCSKCQDAYTENIPATGHSWTVKETVNTTYDAAGVLLKQGYTIFKCSICGEEYKDSSGAGPPGGGGGGESGKPSIWDKLGSLLGSAANGFITVLKTAVIKILDALVAMFDAINTKLASVTTAIFGLFDRIPQLFGGFTGFLSAVFPFFPPEVFDILTLSILILAAATLIKFFLKR